MERIRQATEDELETLRDIERDAGRAFDEIVPEAVAGEPLPPSALETYRESGRAWVAVEAQERPQAYLLASAVHDCLHIAQVSVRSACRVRGLGAALISHVARVAGAQGRPAVTLTTFRDLPWNPRTTYASVSS